MHLNLDTLICQALLTYSEQFKIGGLTTFDFSCQTKMRTMQNRFEESTTPCKMVIQFKFVTSKHPCLILIFTNLCNGDKDQKNNAFKVLKKMMHYYQEKQKKIGNISEQYFATLARVGYFVITSFIISSNYTQKKGFGKKNTLH